MTQDLSLSRTEKRDAELTSQDCSLQGMCHEGVKVSKVYGNKESNAFPLEI